MGKQGFNDYLLLAIKLILVLSILNAITNKLWYIVSTNVFLLILTFVPQIIKENYKLKIPKQFEWFLLIFVVFTLFLGRVAGIIVPITFGIAVGLIAFMILAILYSTGQIKKNYFLMILFSFNFAISLGALIELVKYYLKLALGHSISAGNYIFSMTTLSYVLIGALISSFFGYVYMKGKSSFVAKLVKNFKNINPRLFKKEISAEEVLDLIKKGENEKSEFKSTLRVNLHTNDIDKKIEHSVLKTICAFLNSKGGTLLIGVSNSGEILGNAKDRFEDSDKFDLHLTNLIKSKIGRDNTNLVDIENVLVDEKMVTRVECKKSSKPVFLKGLSSDEEFYIRAGPSSLLIKGSELINYVEKRFGKEK